MSKIIDDGGQAFPGDTVVFEPFGTDGIMVGKQRPHLGMSLRDWFAGQALAGMVSNKDRVGDFPKYAMAAKEAYHWADAMIAARQAEGRI